MIGGDSYYRDENEEARSVISRWARRKVASQFREEYLDGRQSFIFSWDEKHRMIHEEAMRHTACDTSAAHVDAQNTCGHLNLQAEMWGKR